MTKKRRAQVQRVYPDTVDAIHEHRGLLGHSGEDLPTPGLLNAFVRHGIDALQKDQVQRVYPDTVDAILEHRGLLGHSGEGLPTPGLLDAFVRHGIDALQKDAEAERNRAKLPLWRRIDPRRK